MRSDVFAAVLAYEGEAPPLRKGKAYLYPFAQGGKFWRESDVSRLSLAVAEGGHMHYAALSYIRDGEGRPKMGSRELRGLLLVREDAEGRVFIRRDESEWEVVTAPLCKCGAPRLPWRHCEGCMKP